MTMKGWGSKVTVTGLPSFEVVQGPEGKSMSRYDRQRLMGSFSSVSPKIKLDK